MKSSTEQWEDKIEESPRKLNKKEETENRKENILIGLDHEVQYIYNRNSKRRERKGIIEKGGNHYPNS